MRTPARTHPGHERGQSLVELALSLTLILILLSGAVSFGMAYFSYVAIADAAQEGALYGSFDPANIAAIRLRVRTASTSPGQLVQHRRRTGQLHPGPTHNGQRVRGPDQCGRCANSQCHSRNRQVRLPDLYAVPGRHARKADHPSHRFRDGHDPRTSLPLI